MVEHQAAQVLLVDLNHSSLTIISVRALFYAVKFCYVKGE